MCKSNISTLFINVLALFSEIYILRYNIIFSRNHQMKVVLVVLFVSTALVAVHGRSTGAPVDACDSLTPGHGGSSMLNSPFEINMDQFEDPLASGEYFYTPGETYTRECLSHMYT